MSTDYVELVTVNGDDVRVMVNNLSHWENNPRDNCVITLKSPPFQFTLNCDMVEFERILAEDRVKIED